MPSTPQNRWIVQGKEVSSGRLVERIKTDSEITQVRQVAPDVVVLAMSPERAKQLKTEFGGELAIEPDADLSLNAGRLDK
jgi:hypothetical protein